MGHYEVGKTYKVPCIRLKYDDRNDGRMWVAILLPPHSDVEFCFSTEQIHVHPDFRFWPEKLDASYEDVFPVPARIEYRDMLCLREELEGEHPGFVFPMLAMLRRFQNYNIIKGKDGKDCWKCPHRGIDLGNMKPKKDETGREIIRCPGHGLDWNTKTGDLAYKASESGGYIMALKNRPEEPVEANYDPMFRIVEAGCFVPILQLIHKESGVVLAEKEMSVCNVTAGDKLAVNGHKNCPREL